MLAEAVFLAEWPSVARGALADSHLRLPAPVLITAMQNHQRYFPVRDGDGRLLPAFLYVSNADPAAAALVTRGNERVLEGRLDDAEFAYDRDIAEGLETMADRLGDVVFHEKLGSLADKAHRLQGLVAGLAAGPGAAGAQRGGNGSSAPLAETLRVAARLAKADLVSQVVIEFPTLQGVMGGLYAETGGLGDAVARAVGEHYRPLSATAPLPTTVSGALLAIADKADNIVGAWVAGQRPSGSRDPYGLRRAAMGIVRIALEYSLRFPIAGLLASAVDQFEIQGVEGLDDERRAVIVAETAAFVRERLQVLLLDEGLPFSTVEAALAAPAGDVPALAARARTFAALAGRDFFEDAVTAYNRCARAGRQGRGRRVSRRRPGPVRRRRRARAGRGLRGGPRAAARRALSPGARERDQRSGRPAAGRRPLFRRRDGHGRRRRLARQPAGAAGRGRGADRPYRRVQSPAADAGMKKVPIPRSD